MDIIVEQKAVEIKETKPIEAVKTWIETGAKKLKDHLGQLSLEALGGLGWQEIGEKDEFGGACKFSFGKGEWELDPVTLAKGISEGKIIFTGRRLCAYTTHILGEALSRKFPEARVSWVTLYADMGERPEGPYFPELHHLLQFQLAEEEATAVDLTYGQVNHTQPLLFIPSRDIEMTYKDPTRLEGEIEVVDFSARKEQFLKEKPTSYLTDTDLEEMIQLFLSTDIEIKKEDTTAVPVEQK